MNYFTLKTVGFPRHVVSYYDLLPYYVQLIGFTSQVSFPCFSSYRLLLTELNQRALGHSYIIKHRHLIWAEFLVWRRIFRGLTSADSCVSSSNIQLRVL
jgi:hypothetical protein